jgi:hypothetical protein
MPLRPGGVHIILDELRTGTASLKTPNGLAETRLNVGDDRLVDTIWMPAASPAGSGPVARPGMGGVEFAMEGLFVPCHGGWTADDSSQPVLIRAVGELRGVTGALMEPPWINDSGGTNGCFLDAVP